jgi:hypothetical protein
MRLESVFIVAFARVAMATHFFVAAQGCDIQHARARLPRMLATNLEVGLGLREQASVLAIGELCGP